MATATANPNVEVVLNLVTGTDERINHMMPGWDLELAQQRILFFTKPSDFGSAFEHIAQALDAAKSSAQIRAKDDPWDALKLVKLLTYFEFHREAAEIADFIAKEQPKTKKYEWAIVECVIEGSLAAAEEMIIKGRPDLARVILDEGEQLEVSRDEQDNNKRFEDVIDAFTVADRVSRQLKLVQNI